jgi:TetR/AcrR family transcriptional regulator, cholesterol catabolism regulator
MGVKSMAARPRAKAQPSARYEQRRLELLRAAARTFNRRGFHSATLDDVADELGVTKPAIYYYAKNKDELLSACADIALAALELALAATTALPPAERLHRFFSRYAEVICEDFGRCLVMTEPRDLAPPARKSNIAARRALNLGVRDIIRAGVADGSYRPCNELALASALFDSFNGLAKWFKPKGAMPLAQMVEIYMAIFESGMKSPLTAATTRPASRSPAKPSSPRRRK